MANPVLTSTKGVAVYPALNRPDTKFDELGQYKADIKLSQEAAAPLVAAIQKVAKEHMGKVMPKAKNSCFESVLNDDGEETGEVLFKIRVKNKLRKSDGKLWDRRPLIIDAKKNDLPVAVAIWGGTTMRVQFEVYPWNTGAKKGISLQPVMVQVIDLVTGGGRGDANAFDEEDGYEAEEESSVSKNAFDNEDTDSTPATDDDEY
ncbi:ssDNA-binding protein [Rhizobium sp. Leaf341]|uniref:ssDNA-binding protein n=1 Tax=Rhizobium sp. Leaf341 TaxID=1736344 RepID=UPI000712EA03|nr:ssDNA-binding protein [Rhizobium sp. Leaf341]KQR67889.1 hypothetical protein ASG03_10235 [Rhizobium sp. Leaf341]